MSKPLRKCPYCGLEAWTQEDLELFVDDPRCKHGRRNTCKIDRKRQLKGLIPKPNYLKKCGECGLKAYTAKDLELFVFKKKGKPERAAVCIPCSAKRAMRWRRENPLKSRFLGMKSRGYNKKFPKYPSYGGRGITICDEWLNNPETFVEWGLSSGFKHELTIDRIDNNGPYSPENCRWATNSQQQLNKINTVTFPDKKTRVCPVCKKEKQFSKYSKNITDSSGIQRICKFCTALLKKQRKTSTITLKNTVNIT